MGHDIRNHLQAIILGTEIVGTLDVRPEVKQMFDIIVDSVENSQNLIGKVQSTRDLLLVPLANTSLREALDDCLQVINETYTDVQIEVNWNAQQPTVLGDKYLGTLLMNILENAILHNAKKKKRVWLDLREVEEGYEVTIADNGPGIVDEIKESLFDQDRRFGGVGVHQALKIAQKYGGRISVRDRVPGDSSKGAEFHVWLPKSTP
jgi:signal transduction histidine kinase